MLIFSHSLLAQDQDQEKYPKINEVLNNPQLGEEGKCTSSCQAKQLDCYKGADGPKRDQCTKDHNQCIASCGGVIGEVADPSLLNNPSAVIQDLDMDPSFVKQVINAAEGKPVDMPTGQPSQQAAPANTNSPVVAPPPSTTSPVGTAPPSVTDPI